MDTSSMLSQNDYKFDLWEYTANQVTNIHTSDIAECLSYHKLFIKLKSVGDA